MTLSELIAAATAAYEAAPANKHGGKSSTTEHTLPDDRVVTVTIEFKRGRFAWKPDTQTMRFKLDGKVTARAELDAIMGGRKVNWYEAINPVLRTEFEQRAPELSADMKAHLLYVWGLIQKRSPDGVMAHPEGREERNLLANLNSIGQVTKQIKGSGEGMHWRQAKLELDQAALQRVCDKYGMEAAVTWFYKTNQKMGELTEAEIISQDDGYLVVRGKRHGKTVQIDQQRIIKQSPKGKLFHQWPARIYVNGQFTPEAAYQKSMLLADLAA